MTDDRATAHDLIAPELRAWRDAFPLVPLTDETLALMRGPIPPERRRAPSPLTPAQAAVTVEERHIPGGPAAPDVRVLVHVPPGGRRTRPAVLLIHGGGYVLGMPEASDATSRAIAAEQDAIVVAVAYRLAPETRFPGARDDCLAALRWMHGAADALGIDPARIAVAGESAGGGHAAALALHARGLDPPIRLLLLDSPMLDDRTGAAPHPLGDAMTWTGTHNRFGWRALLGAEPGGEAGAAAAPARADDLAGLPPTIITVGALDLFLDENLSFAARLTRAGVPTELHVLAGAFHGFALAPGGSPQGDAQRLHHREALARAFA